MTYEVYPCDLDYMGECPYKCKDCTKCKPEKYEIEEEEV